MKEAASYGEVEPAALVLGTKAAAPVALAVSAETIQRERRDDLVSLIIIIIKYLWY